MLALMTKESAIGFPLLALGLDFLVLRPAKRASLRVLGCDLVALQYLLLLPAFFAPVFLLVIPGVELRHWIRRQRRRRRGMCEDCGYDLRGAMRTCSECGTHVGRCPECGTVVTQAGRFHAAAPG